MVVNNLTYHSPDLLIILLIILPQLLLCLNRDILRILIFFIEQNYLKNIPMTIIHDILFMVRFMNRYRDNTHEKTICTKENGDKMPTVEKVNYEMTTYLQDIEEYIDNYKRLPKKEAKKQAKENLVDVGIIDEQGNLIGFYKNS